MADCEIIGEVQNIAGTGRAPAGTYLTIEESRLPDDAAHGAGSTQRIDFIVGTDGKLKLKSNPTAAAKVAQGADIRFKGAIRGFEAGTKWVTIPETSTVDINILAANASVGTPLPATAISQAALDAHIAKLANPDDAGHIVNVTGALTLVNGVLGLGDLDASYATDAELASGVQEAKDYTDSALASFDLSLYQTRSERNQADGYAGLDSSGLIPDIRLPASIARDSEVTAAVAVETSRAQAAEALLAPLASPTFTGTPAAPTPLTSDVSTRLATTAFVDARFTALINLAPGALDTLGEIAAQLATDESAVAALTTTVAGKQPLDATLTALAGVTTAADKLIYATGADAFSTTDLTAFARTLLDDTTQGAAQTTLGLGTGSSPTFAGLTLTGPALGANGTVAAPTYSFSGATGMGWYNVNGTALRAAVGGQQVASFQQTTAGFTGQQFTFGAGNVVLEAPVLNTLELRNGVNAQTLRVYNTFTDASNYERVDVSWGSNTFGIMTRAGGTGTTRNFEIGTGAGGSAALRFYTNNTLRTFFDANGHLLWQTDNSLDIGASGANRPRNIYAGGNIAGASMESASGGGIFWTSRSILKSPADGIVTLYNTTQTDFSRLQFGGTTSSFPALKRNGAGLDVRLADDSANAPLTASTITASTQTITGGLIGGVVAPAQITANQNDYAINATGVFYRLSTDASRTITGITAPVSGRVVYIINVGSNNLVLANESASSTAANRLHNTTGADITLSADQQAMLWYDGTTARWRVTKEN